MNTSHRFTGPALWMSAVGLALSLVASAPDAGAQRGGGGGARGGGGGGAARAGGGGGSARTNVQQSNANANRNVNQNGNVNRNVNVNQNVNVDRDVHVDSHYDHYDRWGHPIAAAAVTTAAVVAVGTMVATIPSSGCSAVAMGGVSYQHCGSTYYQPVYSGSSVSYVVVNPP